MDNDRHKTHKRIFKNRIIKVLKKCQSTITSIIPNLADIFSYPKYTENIFKKITTKLSVLHSMLM